MKPFTHLFLVAVVAGLLFWGTGITVFAQGPEAPDVQIKNSRLSVNLKDVPLKSVMDSLKKEGGIFSTADKALLDERVSVQFKDLALEDGIKRILSQMNYLLSYGKEGQVLAVKVLGKKSGISGSDGSATARPTPAYPSSQQASIQETGRDQRTPIEGNREVSSPPLGSSAFRPPRPPVKTTREPMDNPPEEDSEEQYKREERARSYGFGVPEIKAKEDSGKAAPAPVTLAPGTTPEGGKVIRNTPPPGGPAKVSPAEAKEQMKPASPASTSDLPGGEPKVTAKELEALKVRKNVDAPGRGHQMSPDGGG